MLDSTNKTRTSYALTLAAVALGIGLSAVAYADDAPPRAAQPDAPGGRHHNPAWAACKKQADDKNLQPGDARHEFMKSCMKAAREAGTTPPAS